MLALMSKSQTGMNKTRMNKIGNKSAASPLAVDVAARLDRPLALVGLMGSGKSVLGRRLAKTLDMGFRDSDQQIVKAAGISIAEIFDLAGEAKFRAMEYTALSQIIAEHPQVIATGGGAFCQQDTAALLLEKTLVVWLKAPPATLLSRIGSTKSRPLLHGDDPLAVLVKLHEQRADFYARAQIHLNTDGLSTHRATTALLQALDSYLSNLHLSSQ